MNPFRFAPRRTLTLLDAVPRAVIPMTPKEVDSMEAELADAGAQWVGAWCDIDTRYLRDMKAVQSLPYGVSLHVYTEACTSAQQVRDEMRRNLETELMNSLAGM